MNAALTLASDQDAALAYLTDARKHHTQAAIAKHLGVGWLRNAFEQVGGRCVYPDTFRIPVSDTQAYKLFSQAAVVPMVEYAAKLMVSQLNLGEKAQTV